MSEILLTALLFPVVATISLLCWIGANFYMRSYGLDRLKDRIEKRQYKKAAKKEKKNNNLGDHGRQ